MKQCFTLFAILAFAATAQAQGRPAEKPATAGAPEVATILFDLGTDSIDVGGEAVTSLLTGEKKRTRWTRAGTNDAFLVLDATALRAAGWTVRSPNGVMLDGPHLFRTGLRLTGPNDSTVVIEDGWQFFGLLDVNRDGRVNASDPEFRVLRLFVDENGDGKMDDGELMYIRNAGVLDIVRVRRVRAALDTYFNHIRVGKFLGVDGVTRVLLDVKLADADAAPFADAFKGATPLSPSSP